MYIIISNLAVRKLSLKESIQAMKNAITLTGVILPLLVSAILVQQGLSFVGLQDALGQSIANAGSNITTIILLSLVLLITGMTLSSVPNMILTAPMLAPAAYSIGLDPLAWGVIFLMNDAIGFITPPFGINLYVASRVSEIEYMKIARAAVPYVVMLYGLWIVFLLFPEINILAN
jgi:C4-dicarboxylate transporter DctM subunit